MAAILAAAHASPVYARIIATVVPLFEALCARVQTLIVEYIPALFDRLGGQVFQVFITKLFSILATMTPGVSGAFVELLKRTAPMLGRAHPSTATVYACFQLASSLAMFIQAARPPARNEAEVAQLEQRINELMHQVEIARREDPRRVRQAINNVKQALYKELKDKPFAKDRDLGMVVLGPTSAGKSTLLNQLLDITPRLPVSARRCTDGCRVVAQFDHFNVYDVFGTNPDELYEQWETVQQIAPKHVALVCYGDAIQNAGDCIKFALAAGLFVIVIRTKIDTIIDQPGETVKDVLEADERQAKELGAHLFHGVSATKDILTVKKLKDDLEIVLKGIYRKEQLNRESEDGS